MHHIQGRMSPKRFFPLLGALSASVCSFLAWRVLLNRWGRKVVKHLTGTAFIDYGLMYHNNMYSMNACQTLSLLPTCSSSSKKVLPVFSSSVCSNLYWLGRSRAATSVVPHSRTSRRASCVKMYWASVCTMRQRRERMLRTKVNTSICCSSIIRDIWVCSVMKVPDRPTPALQVENHSHMIIM